MQALTARAIEPLVSCYNGRAVTALTGRKVANVMPLRLFTAYPVLIRELREVWGDNNIAYSDVSAYFLERE